MRMNHLATTVEEGMRVVLVKENGMENIAVCYDHPCEGKAYVWCLPCWNLSLAVGGIMIAMESGFDRKGKSDKNLQENVNVNVRVVAAAPCPDPFSTPFQSPRASSN